MPDYMFAEGVKPGGITESGQLRILLCFLLENISPPVTRKELEEVLVGEELANYFVIAESFAQMQEQMLITEHEGVCSLTEKGHTVANRLGTDVPRTVREAAVRALMRARRYAMLVAQNKTELVENESGRYVVCSVVDGAGPLFEMKLYVPDSVSAQAVQRKFVENGAEVYRLVIDGLFSAGEF